MDEGRGDDADSNAATDDDNALSDQIKTHEKIVHIEKIMIFIDLLTI